MMGKVIDLLEGVVSRVGGLVTFVLALAAAYQSYRRAQPAWDAVLPGLGTVMAVMVALFTLVVVFSTVAAAPRALRVAGRLARAVWGLRRFGWSEGEERAALVMEALAAIVFVLCVLAWIILAVGIPTAVGAVALVLLYDVAGRTAAFLVGVALMAAIVAVLPVYKVTGHIVFSAGEWVLERAEAWLRSH